MVQPRGLGSQRALHDEVRKSIRTMDSVWMGGKGISELGAGRLRSAVDRVHLSHRPHWQGRGIPAMGQGVTGGLARMIDVIPKHLGKALHRLPMTMKKKKLNGYRPHSRNLILNCVTGSFQSSILQYIPK